MLPSDSRFTCTTSGLATQPPSCGPLRALELCDISEGVNSDLALSRVLCYSNVNIDVQGPVSLLCNEPKQVMHPHEVL